MHGELKNQKVKFIDIREVTTYHLGCKEHQSILKYFMIIIINKVGWHKIEMHQQVNEMMKLEIKSNDFRDRGDERSICY